MTGTLTVRESCVAALAASIAANISLNNPPADPYGVEFTNVYRDAPKSKDPIFRGKLAICIVIEGQEQKSEKSYGIVNCTLDLMIEVHVFKANDEVSAERVNAHMGAIERLLRSDRTLGGKTYEIQFDGTEVQSDGPYESYAAGVVKVRLFYRHHTDDPRINTGAGT